MQIYMMYNILTYIVTSRRGPSWNFWWCFQCLETAGSSSCWRQDPWSGALCPGLHLICCLCFLAQQLVGLYTLNAIDCIIVSRSFTCRHAGVCFRQFVPLPPKTRAICSGLTPTEVLDLTHASRIPAGLSTGGDCLAALYTVYRSIRIQKFHPVFTCFYRIAKHTGLWCGKFWQTGPCLQQPDLGWSGPSWRKMGQPQNRCLFQDPWASVGQSQFKTFQCLEVFVSAFQLASLLFCLPCSFFVTFNRTAIATTLVIHVSLPMSPGWRHFLPSSLRNKRNSVSQRKPKLQRHNCWTRDQGLKENYDGDLRRWGSMRVDAQSCRDCDPDCAVQVTRSRKKHAARQKTSWLVVPHCTMVLCRMLLSRRGITPVTALHGLAWDSFFSVISWPASLVGDWLHWHVRIAQATMPARLGPIEEPLYCIEAWLLTVDVGSFHASWFIVAKSWIEVRTACSIYLHMRKI